MTWLKVAQALGLRASDRLTLRPLYEAPPAPRQTAASDAYTVRGKDGICRTLTLDREAAERIEKEQRRGRLETGTPGR